MASTILWLLLAAMLILLATYCLFNPPHRRGRARANAGTRHRAGAARVVHGPAGGAGDRRSSSYETPSEIEYYSLLAAEVSKLPNNTHLARQALYDRTWVAVASQLQGQNPDQIKNEQLAFQKAICKVEIEMAMYEVKNRNYSSH